MQTTQFEEIADYQDLCGETRATRSSVPSPGPQSVVPAPDFQSGGAGFQTRGNGRYINLGALSPGGYFSTASTIRQGPEDRKPNIPSPIGWVSMEELQERPGVRHSTQT